MFLHNLKMSFRRMRKNPVFTTLNIGGFSIGFAVSIILALFIYKESSVDKNYANHQNIYRLIDAKKNSPRMDYDIAKTIKEQYSEIQFSTPFNYMSSKSPISIKKIGSEENFQIQEVISTTNDFFKIFSINTIYSKTKEPFADLNSVVVTESLAKKLFGKTDVLDEIISINNMMELPICAVVENLPENSSFGTEIFLNSENENFRFSQYCSEGKCYNPLDQYVYINEKTDVEQLTEKMNVGFPANKSDTDSIRFQKVSDIYLATDITNNENKAGSKGLLQIFFSIATIILLMSVINYVNFTLSNQLAALKDLGIKITTGADPKFLRSFYFTEITLSIVISFIVALLIVVLTLPFASNLLATPLKLIWLLNPLLIVVFSLILLAIILISSSAPLFIISRYDVQKLFGKKDVRFGKQFGKKFLTVFQITASIILLVCLVSMQKQLSYVKTTNLGFDKELLVRFNIPENYTNYDALKQQFSDLSFVKEASLSHGGPGFIQVGMGSNEEGNYFQMDCIYVDENFLDVFGIPLLEGSEFLASDNGVSCYINETALKNYGWHNFEGKIFNNGREGGYKIVGVVGDFNVASLHKAITPVCLIYNPNYSAINIKLMPGNLGEQMDQIKETWKETVPGATLNFQFFDEYFDSLYRKEDRQGKAIALFSVIALIITCLGLLGQIVQTCIARIKEIGIRKVNGAKISEVMTMLNKDFVLWVIIAFVIATPIAYYAMNKWLENFAYKTSLSWWIFALAGLLALGIALLTVSWQSWRAATRNPVEALRYE